ncbi:MAG TPA: arginase family protein [Kofleriaceae bacterium]|nr:arginase family protein [Kofleriaceae bacterium]
MSSRSGHVLVVPQWQGYAAGDGPGRGARAIAAALGAPGPDHVVDVPAWHALGAVARGEVLGLDEIAGQVGAALGWLDAAEPGRLLVIGGDCGSDFAPIVWQAGRADGELGVLYLDAHADLNTPATSPSGRFHGMILRAVMGEAAPALAALHRRPLGAAQVVLAGTRDLDAPERDYLEASGIRTWSPAAISDGSVLAAVRAHPARRWHVHFDLDVLDPEDFPDVTVPTPGGPTLAAVTRLLEGLVATRDVVSLAVTEHVGGEASARRVAAAVAALRRAGWG